MEIKSIRVLLFIDSLGAGGAQRQVVETALQLARLGFQVTLAIYHDIRELDEGLAAAGVRVVLVKKCAKLDGRFLWNLYRLFRSVRPDVLHCFLFTPNLWGRLIGRVAKVPVIITSERNIDLPKSRLRVWIERLAHPLSDGIIVNAEAIRDVLMSAAHIPAQKIFTIYNGVDVVRFAPQQVAKVVAARARFNVAKDELAIVVPGRIMPQKNHLCLVKALSMLDEHQRDGLKVFFVGSPLDPVYKSKVERIVSDSGLEDKVIFTGRREDIEVVYTMADIVVLPSLWEGFPNVLLEAMAAGVPVVASDIADNHRLVKNQTTGFLFPSDDAPSLAHVLSNLIAMSPEARAELGKAGRREVCGHYTLRSLTNATTELYARLLGK